MNFSLYISLSLRFSVAIYDVLQPKSRFSFDILTTEKVEISSNFDSGISSLTWAISK